MKVKGSLYWIYSFTSGCKGKMLVAILLAVIGVLCGMAPYFALAGILSGLIQNTLTAERIFCYVGIAVLGETLKMLFNTVSSLKAHRVAYHILGNIRCKLAEKMMNTPPETVPLDRTNGAPRPLKWCMVTAAMVH